MGGSNRSAQFTTVENESLARIKKISKRESSGNKTVQSPSTTRIGASSRTSGYIKGSSHKHGNRGQIFEHGQHQDNIGCQSHTVAQAAAGSKDSFKSVAGSNETALAYDATEEESRRSIAATSTDYIRAGSLTNCVREESIGASPQTGGPATTGISDAVRILGESDDTRAACTVGRAGTTIPMVLLNTVINNVVDDVTFFESWIGLTTIGKSADGLIQSV